MQLLCKDGCFGQVDMVMQQPIAVASAPKPCSENCMQESRVVLEISEVSLQVSHLCTGWHS